MAVSTAKQLAVYFDEVLKTMNYKNTMANLCDIWHPEAAQLQNASDTIWRQVEQHRRVIQAKTLQESDYSNILQLSYPATLRDPYNDAFTLTAFDFRDDRHMMRAAKAAATRLAASQNKEIANLVRDTGSLHNVVSSSFDGYKFISEAYTLLDERQCDTTSGMSFFLNSRDYNRVATTLSDKTTILGKPAEVWETGLIGRNIAGFDVYRTNFLSTLDGAALSGVQVSGAQTFRPIANVTTAPDATLNSDYRLATVTLNTVTSTNLVRGDVITFNGVNAVGLMDKTPTGQLMTFKVVQTDPDNNTINIYPRPIAVNDTSLSAEEAAYANVDNTLADTAAVSKVNTSSAQVNSFWTNDSIEIMSADLPLMELHNKDGMKVISNTLDNGQRLYLLWQGSINDLSLKARMLIWYGLTNVKPEHNGNMVYTGS